MPVTRVYVETSVLGGVFDEEFQDASLAFFDEIRSRRFQFVTSSVVQEELAPAPQKVREFLAEIVEYAEIIDVHEEAFNFGLPIWMPKSFLKGGPLMRSTLLWRRFPAVHCS